MIVFQKKTQTQIVKRLKKSVWGKIKTLKKRVSIKWWIVGGIAALLMGLLVMQKLHITTRLKNKNKVIKDNLITGYYRLTVKPKESLLLDIKFKDVKKLQKKRREAIDLGVLFSSDQDLVPADIRYNQKTIPVKVRLKGDWLDHLKSNKWSLRVEVKDGEVFKGMRRLSLQVPEARNFINEWLFLKILQDEGLISLNYNFLKVTINGETQGIYALEEHFSKEVIERNQRREGPILKFNADRFWQTVSSFGGKSRFAAREHLTDGYYFKSLVESFQQTQLESDPALAELLQLAVNKLQAYREGSLSPSEVFDYEAWSKYLVLADVFGADHGFFWENYRFYFNPVTGKFEPIPFDNEPGKVIENLAIHEPEPEPLTKMFEDPQFVKEYIKALNHYAEQEYVGTKLSEYAEDIDYYTKLLRQDYPYYSLDPMSFFENVDFMKQSMLAEQGIRVTISNAGQVNAIEIENLLKLPVEITKIYWLDNPDNNLLIDTSRMLAGGLTYQLPKKHILRLNQTLQTDSIDLKNLKAEFKVLGQDQSAGQVVSIGRQNAPPASWQNSYSPESSGFIKFNQAINTYVIPKGNFVLDKLITIPTGVNLYIEAGTKIDVRNGGGIISYAPVVFDGNEMHPIKVFSSDGQGQGWLIIGADDNEVNFTEFSNLSPINQQGHTNTGAVVFYEADVKMKNVSFINNIAEDQLNIIRSSFVLDELRMFKATSDGLDIDFGNGKLVNCSFVDMTNDAVDFSGSQAEIDGLIVDGTGDKGVSVGERSQVMINKAVISNAKLGVASKDLSEVTLGKEIEFNNLEVGMAAYQKKPEFGPAYINQDLIQANNVKTGFVIEEGSTLKQSSASTVKGNEKNVGERFQ
ncbi:CotH kinase family protein [Patescibacteria group bacterium]